MELARSSSDPPAQSWIGSLANNMGWARHDAGRYDEALAHLRLALDQRCREGEPVASGSRGGAWGRCLRSLDRVEEAPAEQQTLAADLETAGEIDGYVDEEIGECLLAVGRDVEAHPFLGRAYAELSSDTPLQAGEPERLECLRSLGMV